MTSIRSFLLDLLRNISKFILKRQVGFTPFCVISNDCWGGELYKWTDRPFNTPFIGLMVMAPCYLKFLQNPKYYLSIPLQFKKESFYNEMNSFRAKHNNYPLAILDNIEIHFLHYKNEIEAKEKWDRRKQRMDWEHLVVKFSLDKDYAKPTDLEIIDKLAFPKKVSFSKSETGNFPFNIYVDDYDIDGARMFRLSLTKFSLGKFIKYGKIEPNKGYRSFLAKIQKRFLK